MKRDLFACHSGNLLSRWLPLVFLAGGLLFTCINQTAQAQQPAAPKFSLKQCTKIPRSRRMHGCGVVGNRLYVIGGSVIRDGWTDTVLSSEIQTTAALGQWREEIPMPERRFYISNSVEVVNNRIYVIGGMIASAGNTPENQTSRAKDVLWTAVQPDGTLGRWQKSPPFPGPALSNVATASDDKHLFVVGGVPSGKSEISSDLLVCDLTDDGSPTNWRVAAKLPVPLWYHGTGILEDRMFVWGGLTGSDSNSVNPGVFSAKVRPDGTLDPWSENPPMRMPIYASAFCAFNDYLICVGGRYDGGKPTTDIWYSRLVDQRAQAWQMLNTDLDANVFLSLGLDQSRGWIFVVGGQLKTEPVVPGKVNISSSVQLFRLPQAGDSALAITQAPPAKAATSAPVSGGAPAFLSIEDAQREAGRSGKRVLVLFYSPEVPACKRFWDKVVASNIVASTSDRFVWASVDVSRDRERTYKYNVFKVPAVVLLSSSGSIVSKSIRMIEPADLTKFVSGL